MYSKQFVRMRVGLTGAFVAGMLAGACSAPEPPSFGETRSSALADGAYNSLINDPATGARDWKSTSPAQSGISYWHVGWVSKKENGGVSIDYVLATGYDRLTQKEVVEVVIPQTAGNVAYEFRSLAAAPLDESKLLSDVGAMSDALATSLALGSASSASQPGQPSQCVQRTSPYKKPTDLRTLRRCRTSGATGTTSDPAAKTADPIVVFLNIALDIAQTIQEEAHCDPDVRTLGDDYRGQSASDTNWGEDCANGAGPTGDAGAEPTGPTAGSSCPEIGAVCFSSDGAQRGKCGADSRCWFP